MKSRIFIFLLLFVFIFGCASVGKKIENSEIDTIKEGVTTKSEVLNRLGKPDNVNLTSDGKEIITYSYARATPTLINFIPVVNLLAQQQNVESQTVVILFDQKGIVEKVTTNTTKKPVKAGIFQ